MGTLVHSTWKYSVISSTFWSSLLLDSDPLKQPFMHLPGTLPLLSSCPSNLLPHLKFRESPERGADLQRLAAQHPGGRRERLGWGRVERGGACSAWAQRYWNVNFWLLLSDHTGGSAGGEEGRSERGHHPTTVRVCAAADGAYCEVKPGSSLKTP